MIMNKRDTQISYRFFASDPDQVIQALGQKKLLGLLESMMEIRHFELRAEAAYQRGKVGGFFHAYMGQEAVQVGAVAALGKKQHWWVTTYRCHALALLLGVSPQEAMAELYGKSTGNALGRGGSMHLYSDRFLGGFGIVGGHVPIATGAAFSLKYQNQEGVAVCFLGDGAVAQGAVHESLNLAALWDLPCIYVIENNQWGMGTAVHRAIAAQPIAEHLAKAYALEAYTLDGMDVLACFGGFAHILQEVKAKKKPVLVEAITERLRGHSISDPASYRPKEELEAIKARDPIEKCKQFFIERGLITQADCDGLEEKVKKRVLEAIEFAENSPIPKESSLEEDVFAP